MKIGAMQGILGTDDDLLAIERSAYCGFEAIELITKSGQNGEPLAWTSDQKKVIKTALEENGVMLPSICLGSFNQCGLVDYGSVGKEKIIGGFKDIIKCSQELGVGVILVPFFGNNRIKNEDDQSRAIDGIKEVISYAEKCKVVLALEMTASAEVMLDMVERIDSQCAGIYYDVGNMTGDGFDNAQAVSELGGFISAVHIKDRIVNGKGTPLGEGDVDFKSVKDALEEIGYDQVLILETPSGQDPEIEARKNLAFVKKIWGL
jgi:L-ribulose-5-phosphate 3-epimerase